jgi:autotransporter-associated beta strand protein
VDVLISGAIVGAGNGFNKAGAGTLEITSNSNTYTGNTTVGAGTLVINGNISTSALTTVNSGGTLSGTGTVGKASVAAGGILAPGNSIGTLNFSDTLNLTGISNFEIDPLLALGLNADRANVTNGLTYGGTLNVVYSGSSTNFASGMAFNLFDASTFTGSFATLNLPSLSDGLTWQNDLATNGSLSVIPEPNSAMLLGALGVLGAFRRRRA